MTAKFRLVAFKFIGVFTLLFSIYFLWLFRYLLNITILTVSNLFFVASLAMIGVLFWKKYWVLDRFFAGMELFAQRASATTRWLILIVLLCGGAAGLLLYIIYYRNSPDWFSFPNYYSSLLIYCSILLFFLSGYFFAISKPTRREQINYALVLVNLVFISFVIYDFLSLKDFLWADDTNGYLGGNDLSYLFSHQLWLGRRPFTLPILYTLFDPLIQPRNIVMVQSIIYVAAWSYLAWTISVVLKTNLSKLVGFSFVLIYALTPQIHVWNRILLSESIALSIMALTIALTLHWFYTQNTTLLPLLAVATFFGIGIRDASAYWYLFLGASVFLTGIIVKKWKAFLPLVAIFVAFAFLGFILVNLSGRFKITIVNNIWERILPYPSRLQFFLENGMPSIDKDEIQGLRELYEFSDTEIFNNWLDRSSSVTYLKLIVLEFPSSLTLPLASITFPTPFEGRYLWPNGYSSITSTNFNKFVLFTRWDIGTWLFLLIGLFSALIHEIRFKRYVGLSSLLLLVTSIPYFLVAWYGDSFEIERHILLPSVAFRLGLFLGLLCALDMLVLDSRVYSDQMREKFLLVFKIKRKKGL